MSWQQKIPACFGDRDVKFALHPSDPAHAEEAIAGARAAGASFQDFEKEVVNHCHERFQSTGHGRSSH